MCVTHSPHNNSMNAVRNIVSVAMWQPRGTRTLFGAGPAVAAIENCLAAFRSLGPPRLGRNVSLLGCTVLERRLASRGLLARRGGPSGTLKHLLVQGGPSRTLKQV